MKLAVDAGRGEPPAEAALPGLCGEATLRIHVLKTGSSVEYFADFSDAEDLARMAGLSVKGRLFRWREADSGAVRQATILALLRTRDPASAPEDAARVLRRAAMLLDQKSGDH